MHTFERGRIVVEQGDITRSDVDAVVNAANSSLLGGGGVDGAIHAAGGDAILEECREISRDRYPDGMPAGNAVVTGAGNLPARAVIHTVGPVWHGGDDGEDDVLESAYRNSLELATEHGFDVVAFPAISTGVYGFPKDRAARIAFQTVSAYLSRHDQPGTVRFVLFSDSDISSFLDAIESID